MRDLIVSALFGGMNELLEESNSTLSNSNCHHTKSLASNWGKSKRHSALGTFGVILCSPFQDFF